MKRKNSRKLLLTAAVSVMAFTACHKVPDHIIQPEVMAEILADMHVGEAVIENNRMAYVSDSVKMLMKQSVLEKHGADMERFDSSLSWYAHNPQLYLEVYDNTIDNLQKRIKENGAQLAQSSLSAAGDSVDLWSVSRYGAVNTLSAGRFITFDIKADDNSEAGDRYTWRACFVNNLPHARWGIAATYDNGTVETLDSEVENEGWNEIMFVTDSTLKPKEIYGYMEFDPRPGIGQWVDSIQLVRNRKNVDAYKRRYKLKTYR